MPYMIHKLYLLFLSYLQSFLSYDNKKLNLSVTYLHFQRSCYLHAAAVKLLQSCLTLCDPIDGSLLGSPVPGILQARTLEWVAISFSSPMHESEKWKWSRSVVSYSVRPHGLQPTRLLRAWDFPGKSTRVGCHCLLRWKHEEHYQTTVFLHSNNSLCSLASWGKS